MPVIKNPERTKKRSTPAQPIFATAKTILTENWEKVERMVASLLEYETVEADEVKAILEGRPYDRGPAEEVAASVGDDEEIAPADEPKRLEKPTRLPPTISPEPA